MIYELRSGKRIAWKGVSYTCEWSVLGRVIQDMHVYTSNTLQRLISNHVVNASWRDYDETGEDRCCVVLSIAVGCRFDSTAAGHETSTLGEGT
jgi:hypothetical protein